MSATNAAKTRVIEGLTFSAQELSPFTVIDLSTEFADLISSSVGGKGALALAAGIMKGFGAGKLRELLPRLLQSVTTTVSDGGKPQRITLDSVESMNIVFSGRMKALAQVVAFAVEVSFADFLAGIVLVVPVAKAKSG
jgi:hypothetical protein